MSAAHPPPRDTRLDGDTARWLISPEGLSAAAAATAALGRGETVLAVGSGLRREGIAAGRAAAVTLVAEARRRAQATYPDVDALVLTPGELEQASHPAVSAHRAQRFADAATVVDLCGGAGLDAAAIASGGPRVVSVDAVESRSVLAGHTARVRGVAVDAVTGDALRPPIRLDGLVHADPSRRSGERRARRLADYRPAVGALASVLAGAEGWGIVVSPGVDLDDPDLPNGELEFLQVGPALVEAAVWGGYLAGADVRATATLLPAGEQRRRSGDPVVLRVGEPGEWLVEIAPAAVRARLHTEIGEEVGAWRLASQRALLTSAAEPPASPWYAATPIAAVLPLRARIVREWLRGATDGPIEILRHGVDMDVDAFWREVGQPDRGSGGWRLHLVRLDEGAVALICTS